MRYYLNLSGHVRRTPNNNRRPAHLATMQFPATRQVLGRRRDGGDLKVRVDPVIFVRGVQDRDPLV